MVKTHLFAGLSALLLTCPCLASGEEPTVKRQKDEDAQDTGWYILNDDTKLNILSYLTPDVRAVTRRVNTDFRRLVEYMENESQEWRSQIRCAKKFHSRIQAYFDVPYELAYINLLWLAFPTRGTLWTSDVPIKRQNKEIAVGSPGRNYTVSLEYGEFIQSVVKWIPVDQEDYESQESQSFNRMMVELNVHPQQSVSIFNNRFIHDLRHPGEDPVRIVMMFRLNQAPAINQQPPQPVLTCQIQYHYADEPAQHPQDMVDDPEGATGGPLGIHMY